MKRNDVRPPALAVRTAVRRALEEDLLPNGDLTASLLDPGLFGSAVFVARRPGVIAGTDCVVEAFRQVDPALEVEVVRGEGEDVGVGGAVARVRGPFAPLLSAERTALNFLCHLSGVATLTDAYVARAAAANPATRVWDTRKTTPGLRALEKAAVRAGGGANHRASLSEAVLVKDNHLGGISITEALERARQRWPGRMLEVECDRLEQVEIALEAGATLVLCDNMTPEEVAACVALVRRHARAGAVLVEASGGVDLDSVGAFAAAGADVISVGALTHSAPALDIGLDLESDA